jgi:hypothetical protein
VLRSKLQEPLRKLQLLFSRAASACMAAVPATTGAAPNAAAPATAMAAAPATARKLSAASSDALS